jgi:NAD(P)-dependent dehydrogenase (short-subunit alcohol dehydrogenase family)
MAQIWFVTGASRGLGFAIAQAVLEKGDAVVAAARNASRAEQVLGPSDRVFAVSVDVTDRASIQRAADTAVARFGKIDVIVNNAGYGLMGAVEELDALELEDVFKTNFFGARDVIRALLPTLRAQRAGWIVNISSVGGFTGTPGAGAYNASKFALEGLSEALAQELAPLGIRVLIVEPGYFRTDFLNDSMRTAKATIADYADSSRTDPCEPTATHRRIRETCRYKSSSRSATHGGFGQLPLHGYQRRFLGSECLLSR